MSEMTVIVLGRHNGAGETRSCPACKAAMRLVGIEPHHLPTSNDDIYTFECVVCGMTTAEVVSNRQHSPKSETLVSSVD